MTAKNKNPPGKLGESSTKKKDSASNGPVIVVVKAGRSLPVKGGRLLAEDVVAKINLGKGVSLNILADAIRSGRVSESSD